MKVPEKITFKDSHNINSFFLSNKINEILEYLEINTETDEKLFNRVQKELNEEFEKKEESGFFDNHEEHLKLRKEFIDNYFKQQFAKKEKEIKNLMRLLDAWNTFFEKEDV